MLQPGWLLVCHLTGICLSTLQDHWSAMASNNKYNCGSYSMQILARVPIAQHGLAPGYLCKLMCKSLSASTVLLVRYALLIVMICLFPGPALSTSLTSSLSCFCIPAPCFCSRDSWVLHFVMTFLRHFEA